MRFQSSLALALLLLSCRSTTKPISSVTLEAQEAPAAKTLPVGIGDGFQCLIDKRGQGVCQDSKTKAWKTLRALNSVPNLKHLTARSTVVCGIGTKPAALENRVICWQPQTNDNAIMLSAKINTRMRSLSLQKDKVCVLFAEGVVGCGSLTGNSSALKFANVKNLRAIRSLQSGEGFSCGIRDTGTIFCWGDNSKGQLGVGSRLAADNEPVPIAGFSGSAVTLDAGSRHVCAINDSGEVFCWGMNSDQQLGIDGADTAAPQAVRGLPLKAHALALGEKHSCAQLIDGTVWCWGAAGRLGSDTPGGLIPSRVPLAVASAAIVASVDKSCSQLTTGEIFCWGNEPEILAPPL